MGTFESERTLNVQNGQITMEEALAAYEWLLANTSFTMDSKAILCDLKLHTDPDGTTSFKLKGIKVAPFPSPVIDIVFNGFDDNDYYRTVGVTDPSAEVFPYCDGLFLGQPNVLGGGQPGVLSAVTNLKRRVQLIQAYTVYHYFTDIEDIDFIPTNNNPLFETTWNNPITLPTYLSSSCTGPEDLTWRANYIFELAADLQPSGKEFLNASLNTIWFKWDINQWDIYHKTDLTYGIVHTYIPPDSEEEGG